MILKSEMPALLLDACPSFRPIWDAFLIEWEGTPADLPLHLLLSDFAGHLINLLQEGETVRFPATFGAIERLLTDGEHYVREAAIVSLLEGLQNLNLHESTNPNQIRPFLGPESAIAWEQLYEFWANVRAARAAGLLEPKAGPSMSISLDGIEDPELRRIMQHMYRQG